MTKILVDPDLCTRCGICSLVCLAMIIEPAEGDTLPVIRGEKSARCMRCGHCEAFCPSEALIVNDRPEEKIPLPAGGGTIAPGEMELYLKKRRSVRHFTRDIVPKETIEALLDIARYAASAGNGQPVEWIVVYDPDRVKKIAGLTVEWLKTLLGTDHPMSGYLPVPIAAWEAGKDPITRDAPHLLVATVPEGNSTSPVDAIIALTHVDLAAPAFGIGVCWAGFVAGAALNYAPLRNELQIPPGRQSAYALMFGNPQYKITAIPRRNPLRVTWLEA